MQVAVLSDIHANRHALEAVLDDVRRTGARELWCLGDLVGYGADPNDCVALVREHVSVCIAGNHDLAVTGELPLDDFSAGAALAAGWTQEVIEPGHLEYLRSLRPQLITEHADLYHGSPRDPVWEYVVGVLLAELCLDRLERRIGLIGHSHVALSFEREDGSPASGSARRGGDTLDISSGSWLLNPGSVGQPRDGDPRAAWLLLDLTQNTASWRRTEYDIAGAADAIRAARLPDSLADRLGYGQ
jgi:predicted phosphodiesterase